MNEVNEQNMAKKDGVSAIKKFLTKKVVIGIVLILVLVIGAIGLKESITFDNKTTKIGFENIGELATQSAYCTEVHVTDNPRELWGVKIPFTQSKYIYSYDIIIKAGFDFGEITWNENDATKTIHVQLPEAKILSSEPDMDSFKVYHEDESIFNQITLTENNEALNSLIQQAEADAIANGILDNAISNAKAILTGFFANAYDLTEYTIDFNEQ